MAQPLLSPTSVALSLSPPRIPPHGSVLRNLYTNPKGANNAVVAHHRQQQQQHDHNHNGDNNSRYQSHTLTSRLLQLFTPHFHHLALHPHLPTSLSIPDKLTRLLGVVLPLELQHSLRDDGFFQRMADGMVTLSCPMVGVGHWKEVREFLELSSYSSLPRDMPLPDGESSDVKNDGLSVDGKGNTQRGKRRKWTRKKIPYGEHPMQYVDLFLPTNYKDSKNDTTETNSHSQSNDPHKKTSVRGTVFFVHGGAWGSGQPWMYRLVAPMFLKLNFAVVIVGYRTYPDAPTIDDQCGDVRLAWDKCEHVLNELVVPIRSRNNDDDDGWVGNVIMGHSSGAHVALLMLVDMIGEQMKDFSSARPSNSLNNNYTKATNHTDKKYPWAPNYFIGLSGPYDISYHFDYEAGRGVEQISPMKPICGNSRENFHKASPVKRLLSLLGEQREETIAISSTIQQLTPPILLVHGIEDNIVPFTATADAGRLLRSCGLKQCDEIYLEDTSHQDVIMHIMLGGPAKDLVLDWLMQTSRRETITQLQSRL